MNSLHKPGSLAKVLLSFRFEFQFDLPLEIRRGVALFIAGFVLAVFADGNVGNARAQSQTEATPAATPTPTPAQPETKPGANKTASPAVTGTIKGRLVADDGQPLTNANVMVQSLTAAPAAKPARVDSEGRFAFEELPPAAYLVIATAPGYIDRTMSLGDPAEWPRHLIGSNVRITMIRGGVITGTVNNAKGEPITGVPVRAMMSGNSSSITSLFSGGGLAETDDRGVYRIYGLLPGQYVVQAGGKGSFGQFTASGFDIDVPTYYPSATRDTAVPVSVRGGDETTGIDIKYRGTEGHTISGFVLGNVEASAISGAVTIFLSHANTTSALSLEIAAAADPRRAFSFNGIADGEYDVFASYFTGAADNNGLVATKRVVVRGGDVTGIELRLASLASITGTITLDPIKPEDKCDKRGSQLIETILNAPRDETKKRASRTMVSMIGGGLGTLNDKGEFSLRNLEAARYRLEIKLPSESWYLRTINLPGASAERLQQSQTQSAAPSPNLNTWPGLVTLKSGEHLSGASITVGQDAAGMRGRTLPEGTPVRERTYLHLVPVDHEQANNVLRYSESLVNRDGSFALTNIAPGRYFILVRVEPATEIDAPPRPVAWDPTARIKLRREAETANAIVELKSCQRVVDYTVKPVTQ